MYHYLFSLCALVLNNITGYYIRQRNVTRCTYDVGQRILPDIRRFNRYNILNDGLATVAGVVLVTNYNILDAYFFMMTGYMYGARALTSFVTTFQNPRDTRNDPGMINYANDYIFSGHVTLCILASYFTGVMWPILPIVSSVFTISTREHYTVDVIIAWILFYALLQEPF